MLLSSSSHVSVVFSSHIILQNRIYLQGFDSYKKWLFLQIHSSYKLPLELVGRNDELTFVFVYMCVRLYLSTKSVQTDCIDSHKRY